MATKAIPVRITWTDEQKAAIAPLFAKLKELNDAGARGTLSVFGQATDVGVYLFLTPAAPSKEIRKVLDRYKSAIAATQPEQPAINRAYYQAETGHDTPHDGDNGRIVAYYLTGEGSS